MAENSKIEWTEHTWNCLAGCTEISPGCLNCYAAVMAHRLAAMGQKKYQGTTRKLPNGKVVWTGVVNLDEEALKIPLKRKKPTVYFVNSMSDLFHESVPYEFIDNVFTVMERCPQHTFQVLTKRADRMARYCKWRWGKREDGPGSRIPARNIWLGISAEDQKRADGRIPHLLQCPAAVRFVSYEPAVGPVEFIKHVLCDDCETDLPLDSGYGGTYDRLPDVCDGYCPKIDWLIVGGESGHGARPFDVAWARSAVKQCKLAGVPVFVKQIGSNPKHGNVDGWPKHIMVIPNNAQELLGLKDSKGGDPSEWPEDLRVRQFPKLAHHSHGATT